MSNEKFKRKYISVKGIADNVKYEVLGWFGYVQTMTVKRMIKEYIRGEQEWL